MKGAYENMITKDMLKTKEYDFLRTKENLGNNVILLALSGSYSYGTNIDKSDIDIRGITLNRKSDLIGMTSFDQYVDENTDTCVYGFNKIINLFLNCNPNTIELLGLNKEHYLFLNEIGQELLDNKKMFLSKRAIQSFGGYATAQLHRLKNDKKKDEIHLNKHAMHLIRLFMMAIDILEKEEINTYRINEQNLLLNIRNGKYQKADGTFNHEFYELLSDYEKRLDYASNNTNLPEEPDMTAVEKFVMSINERVVRGEI